MSLPLSSSASLGLFNVRRQMIVVIGCLPTCPGLECAGLVQLQYHSTSSSYPSLSGWEDASNQEQCVWATVGPLEHCPRRRTAQRSGQATPSSHHEGRTQTECREASDGRSAGGRLKTGHACDLLRSPRLGSHSCEGLCLNRPSGSSLDQATTLAH